MSVSTIPAKSSVRSGATAGLRLRPEAPTDADAVERLADRVFGPGRFAKVSERVREGNVRDPRFCFCASDGARIAGSVRMWPVHIGLKRALFLGPLAVDPSYQHQGLGAGLVSRACEAAEAAGEGLVLLVGARGFFEPLGFSQVPDRVVILPGAVDPQRLLWRELAPGYAVGCEGALRRG